jgi:YVTN family beta-propeller protein
VSEFDEGGVAVIDPGTGRVVAHHSSGGTQPTGIAVSPDGEEALVTNSFSGSLAFVSLDTGHAELLPLPGAPYDVVISPDGKTAFVSVSQMDQVAVVDIGARAITQRLPTGRRPRSLSLSPDGRVLAVGNMTQGSVTFISAADEPAVVGHGPTPAVNLRGVALLPGARQAFAAAQRAQNERPTETAVGVWSNQAFLVRPNGGANGDANLWLDFMGKDVAEPEAVVLDPQGQRAFVTCGGGHSVNVVPVRGSGETLTARNVGAQPKGLALRPGTKELWVANRLSNDLAVIDSDTLQVLRRVNLGVATKRDPAMLGEFLFVSASLARGQQFSCNSCHPDAGTDSISWKFVHVPDGLGKETNRNVRSLLGSIRDTGPFRWSGHAPSLDEFVQEELVGLFQGTKLEPEPLAALVGYLGSRPLGPNPHRSADQSFTETAERGRALFAGKAECGTCHTGPKFGGQRKAWIGTTPEGVELDVPHLTGVFDSYPYLHDGRAPTLPEIWSKSNPRQLHGKAHLLSAPELADLLEFVRQL